MQNQRIIEPISVQSTRQSTTGISVGFYTTHLYLRRPHNSQNPILPTPLMELVLGEEELTLAGIIFFNFRISAKRLVAQGLVKSPKLQRMWWLYNTSYSGFREL